MHSSGSVAASEAKTLGTGDEPLKIRALRVQMLGEKVLSPPAAAGSLRLTEAPFGSSIYAYRGHTGRRVTPAWIERDLERLTAMDRSHS